jgi:hypothetical protein
MVEHDSLKDGEDLPSFSPLLATPLAREIFRSSPWLAVALAKEDGDGGSLATPSNVKPLSVLCRPTSAFSVSAFSFSALMPGAKNRRPIILL